MNVSFKSISCQNGSVVLSYKPTPVQTEQDAVEKDANASIFNDCWFICREPDAAVAAAGVKELYVNKINLQLLR